jgi:LmbE family N-acetylglucosaminyl deacetylase
MPDKSYHCIYLSPHLDDAALSCGGRIFQERQAGLLVLVLTLMAGDPPSAATETLFVAELHARWELDAQPNPVAVRRAEDKEALSVLGVDGLHWEWPDCIYRRNARTGDFLYQSNAALFGSPHPVEKTLIEELARRLADLPLAPAGRVYAPLTAGGHVDHRLVRRAAELWGPPHGELFFYEDYPYAERPEALTAVVGEGGEWQTEAVSLDERAMAAKTAAVACYRSQISTFFESEEEMAARLRAFAAIAGGERGWAERYWRHKTSFVPNSVAASFEEEP